MKKRLLKILGLGLSVVMLLSTFAGCGSSKWKGSDMSDWGNVVNASLGGFVAETDNYLYYINGVGTSSSDNALGKPTKGALYAVSKADLTKTSVAVPKLFAATDYDMGVFISGDYVYYGTPSTDKNSEGNIAYTDMAVTRSKLDGTETTTLFTVDSLALKHRFVEKDGAVYVVYYDGDESAIVSYNAKTEDNVEIAKTDATTDKMETLGAYNFVDKVGADGLTVLYTATVYSEAYNEDKLNETGASRGTENYNKVYAFVAGETEGKLIFDGKTEDATYAITLVKNGYVYYTKTINGTAKTYAVSTADFVSGKAGVEVFADYAVATTLVCSLSEVYTVAEGKVYKDTMVKSEMSNQSKRLVASCETISNLLFKDGDFIYYYNSSNNIARIKLNDEDAKEVRISDNTVTTTWFAPEKITVGGKDYLFYIDNSSFGLSYVKYVELNHANIVAKDTDDNDEDDLWYLSGSKFLSVLTDDDKASIVTANLNNLDSELKNGKLVFEEVDGALVATAVKEAREEYNALSNSVKEKVSETALAKLENMEKATSIASLLKKVSGIIESADKESFKDGYNAIKTEINAFFRSEDFSSVSAYIDSNMFAEFQYAEDRFETK